MATNSEVIRAKRKAVGGKKDRCRKGKSCSATCISGWKACLVEMSANLSKPFRSVRESLQKRISTGVRRSQFNKSYYNKVLGRIEEVSKGGDKREYKKLLKLLPKLTEKAKRLNSKADWKGLEGKLKDSWKYARMKDAQQRVRERILEAVASGDRGKYNKLMSALGRLGAQDKARDYWNDYQGVAHFMSRLNKSDIYKVRKGTEGVNITFFGGKTFQSVNIVSKVLGNKLTLEISPDSMMFSINDSFTASNKLSLREKIALGRETKRQFAEVIKSLGEGATVAVIAENADGKEETRIKAYKDTGFSDPDREGYMYGKVYRGRMIPISANEMKHQERFSVSG